MEVPEFDVYRPASEPAPGNGGTVKGADHEHLLENPIYSRLYDSYNEAVQQANLVRGRDAHALVWATSAASVGTRRTSRPCAGRLRPCARRTNACAHSWAVRLMLEKDIVAAIRRYLGHAGRRRVLLEGTRRPVWDFGRARYYLLLQGTVPGAGSQAAGRQAHAAAKAGAGEDQPRRRHRPAGGKRGRRQGTSLNRPTEKRGRKFTMWFHKRANGRTDR